jgi:signal transduction histidine kinase/CheY-like chemotaxis protein/tetratricopeptide (TPR) repeat protein
MYQNPFVYKRPLYPGRDDLVIIDRNVLLQKTMTGLEFGHWFSLYCGKKTGKTTFLLRLLDECKMRHPNYHFVMVSLEDLPKFSQFKLNRLLWQKTGEILADEFIPPLQNEANQSGLQELKQMLAGIAERLNGESRIIFVLDSFETAPRAFAQEILRCLINLYHSQATFKPLAKFQFIVAGTLTLTDLQMKKDRAFSEYAMKVFLEDFRYEDIAQMISRVCDQLDIPCQTGFVRLLYEATGGTGYLIQKICYRILETAFLRKSAAEFTIKDCDEAIKSIIREGETNAEMIIRQIERDNQLVENLVQTMQAGAIKSYKFDHHLKSLVSLGALTEHNGAYRVRNRIYETIFQDYFTTERLANIYFSQKRYHRAKELFFAAVTQQIDAKNALETLLTNSKTIGATIKQHDAAKTILQTFMNIVERAQNGSLMMFDRDRVKLKIIEAIGLEPEDMAAFVLKTGEGVAGWVAQTGRTRVVRDVTDEIECPDFVDRAMAIKMNIGAMISLPLEFSGKVIGVINLCLGKPHEFTQDEVKILEVLAAQAAMALRNLRLHQSVEKQRDYFEVIQQTIQDLSRYADLEVILEKILAAARRATGYEKAYFVYKETTTDSWQFKFSASLNHTNLKTPKIEKGEGVAGYVLSSGRAYVAADAPSDAHYFEIWKNVRAEFAVPLMIDGEVNGCLAMAADERGAFSEAPQRLIAMVADLACIAIKNHRLYGIAEKKTQQVITAKGIGEAISHETSLQEILNLVAYECLNVVGYPNKIALVLLKDEDHDRLIIKAACGENNLPKYFEKSQPAQKNSLADWAFRQSQPRIVNNTKLDAEYLAWHPAIRSEIVVPLVFRHENIGVINIQSTMPDDFDQLDQESLLAVAHNAAVAIANARLSEDLKKAQISLAKALEAAAIEEAVAGLTHDIKNFSSLIAGETQWLEKRDRENQLDFGEVKRAIREINSYVQKIEDFTNNLKGRAYKLPPQPNWFTLRVVIDEAVRLIAAKAARQTVMIQKDDHALDVQIFADSGLLMRAFFNIMANAVDAMPEGGNLRISAQTNDQHLQIIFADTGTGIPEEYLGKVFNPFFSTKERGYGLGLAITKRIIETDHRGKLYIKSTEGHGTIVEAWLPLNADRRWQNNANAEDQSSSPQLHKASKQVGNILVVNDDAMMLKKIIQFISSEGHAVSGTECGQAAVEICQKKKFDAIVLDYHLKKDHSATQTANDFFPALKKLAPTTPIILTSASLDQLGVPQMYCDFFLEINQSFWNKILDLINNCLLGKPELSVNFMA